MFPRGCRERGAAMLEQHPTKPARGWAFPVGTSRCGVSLGLSPSPRHPNPIAMGWRKADSGAEGSSGGNTAVC